MFLVKFAIIATGVLSTQEARQWRLKVEPEEGMEVIGLSFGKVSQRRRAMGEEEIVLTLSTGEERRIALEEVETIRRLGACGWRSQADESLDVVMTGCDGEDRSVTVGGHGGWEFDVLEGSFRRAEDLYESDKAEIASDDPDKKLTTKIHANPPAATKDAFLMEIRYYYDQTLLDDQNGDHNAAKAIIAQLHLHASVWLKHNSIGRLIYLENYEDPVFWSHSMEVGSTNDLSTFKAWLQGEGVCSDTIGLHHLVAGKGSDLTFGHAYVGTACHKDCWNAGMTETNWGGPMKHHYDGRMMSHEIGHNLGMLHNFEQPNPSNCADGGLMSYNSAFINAPGWSSCAKAGWKKHYDDFYALHDDARVDGCFKPIPHPEPAAQCKGWSCDVEGQFCPPNRPGSNNGGYCCLLGKWRAGSCEMIGREIPPAPAASPAKAPIPDAAECKGWSCSINGQFCPSGRPGNDFGFCCTKEGKWKWENDSSKCEVPSGETRPEDATSCHGWKCDRPGQFCPRGTPGADHGYCCRENRWVGGNCGRRRFPMMKDDSFKP